MKKKLLTQERLKEMLDYDPTTGFFIWRIASSNRVKVGNVAGHLQRNGYRDISIDGERNLAHRLAFLYMTGKFPPDVIDHIDGCPDNDVWINLRSCSITENIRNSRISKNNTSGAKGVSFDKQKQRWVVRVYTQHKYKHLGYFNDFDLADLVATEARELYHGAYARHL